MSLLTSAPASASAPACDRCAAAPASWCACLATNVSSALRGRPLMSRTWRKPSLTALSSAGAPPRAPMRASGARRRSTDTASAWDATGAFPEAMSMTLRSLRSVAAPCSPACCTAFIDRALPGIARASSAARSRSTFGNALRTCVCAPNAERIKDGANRLSPPMTARPPSSVVAPTAPDSPMRRSWPAAVSGYSSVRPCMARTVCRSPSPPAAPRPANAAPGAVRLVPPANPITELSAAGR